MCSCKDYMQRKWTITCIIIQRQELLSTLWHVCIYTLWQWKISYWLNRDNYLISGSVLWCLVRSLCGIWLWNIQSRSLSAWKNYHYFYGYYYDQYLLYSAYFYTHYYYPINSHSHATIGYSEYFGTFAGYMDNVSGSVILTHSTF